MPLLSVLFALSSCSEKIEEFKSKIIGGDASSSSSLPNEASSSAHGKSESEGSVSYENAECDPISFHFIERNEQWSGDAIYVKAGDNDILIDAGARGKSADAIASYMEDSSRADHLSDGELEYVIATHAHRDHITGFAGTSQVKGIFYRYTIDNLIDFSYAGGEKNTVINNADPENKKNDSRFVSFEATYDKTTSSKTTTSYYSSDLYRDYVEARTYIVDRGTVWYTVGELCNANQLTYTINLGKNLSMSLVYTYFYDHTSDEVKGLESSYTRSGFSDENDYSICLYFTQGSRHFLFTGDAETYAEHSLVKYNSLPKMDLFKAGHHGSYTASSDELLDVVDPKLCVVTCCAGNQEYARGEENKHHTFPAQEFIDRIAKHTSWVYVTTLGEFSDTSKHHPFNGHVVVSYNEISDEQVTCSNNSIPLKDSEWMKENRTMPEQWK